MWRRSVLLGTKLSRKNNLLQDCYFTIILGAAIS
jgi:hypothetical protein